MRELTPIDSGCCSSSDSDQNQDSPQGFVPLAMFKADDEESCCGPPPAPPSSPLEKPGYALWHFVTRFMDTAAGPVPLVKTQWETSDRWGALGARMLGLVRNRYLIAPGLYGVGNPDSESPVLVTANYKLSFDVLRKELEGISAWILVLDTRGINVWCAAGKNLFSTEEVVRMVRLSRLERVVGHQRLILPQLSATGVSAQAVKKGCGFEVVWGPVRAGDLPTFLRNGGEAAPDMRQVTFKFKERIVLVPIEMSLLAKPALGLLVGIIILSGIGPDVYSLGAVWHRGLMGLVSLGLGILTGAVLTPILLPWIPGAALALKGALTGLIGVGILTWTFWGTAGIAETIALVSFNLALSSYLAMNFTGSTPYTSPSGVEKEMRKALPLQAAGFLAAIIIWLGSAFTT